MTMLSLIEMADRRSAARAQMRSEADWPIVRVIWGRAFGSTYQAYRWQGISAPRLRPDGPAAGESVFSRPLHCPGCEGPMGLRQLHPWNPDRLIGDCRRCGTLIRLEVGPEGRIAEAESTS